MKVTQFGTSGLPIALGGWSSGVTAISSNATVIGGLTAQNFVQRITANSSNTLLNPIVNFASGAGISLAAASNTITISSTGGGAASSSAIDTAFRTTNISITATTEATAQTVLTTAGATYDGGEVDAEFNAYAINRGTTTIYLMLFEGATVLAYFGVVTALGVAMNSVYRFQPSAGSHTYTVKASVDAGTGVVGAGAAGSDYVPTRLRITKV